MRRIAVVVREQLAEDAHDAPAASRLTISSPSFWWLVEVPVPHADVAQVRERDRTALVPRLAVDALLDARRDLRDRVRVGRPAPCAVAISSRTTLRRIGRRTGCRVAACAGGSTAVAAGDEALAERRAPVAHLVCPRAGGRRGPRREAPADGRKRPARRARDAAPARSSSAARPGRRAASRGCGRAGRRGRRAPRRSRSATAPPRPRAG